MDIKTWDLRLFQWSCKDNCKYECMWKTVDGFLEYEKFVPQFYGKWPFIRMFGIQEPASTLFSIFNLVIHYKYISHFRIRPNGGRTDEWMTVMWKLYALVSPT